MKQVRKTSIFVKVLYGKKVIVFMIGVNLC